MTTRAELADVCITHARRGAGKNAFAYRALYLILPLNEPARERRPFFGIDRFNLFSFHARDHGDGKTDLDGWARRQLARHGIEEADGEIVLMTLPRVLGYVFNPVSFWLCHDRARRLRAVIAEVNNTFGERHVYVCHHDDVRPIAKDDWLIERKAFYVSPFLTVEGEYKFRFDIEADRFAVSINHHDEEGLRLTTGMAGRREPLTGTRLLRAFLRNPLMPLKVIALIHWQALRLMLKGVRYHAHSQTREAERANNAKTPPNREQLRTAPSPTASSPPQMSARASTSAQS
jgi:DUF1365 family protein